MSQPQAFLGIDVGSGSVRAALFDRQGTRLGMGVHPIQIFRPQAEFVEQSSEDIWAAAGKAVRAALSEAGCEPESVAGIGFDATCSLVLLDADDKPVSVSPTGNADQNVIMWMDHRAIDQAARINESKHAVLQYVGGVISPEMQTPKLLWLAEHLPAAFAKTARFLDLPDYLTYRATGSDTRSLCTTVCKWTYLGKEDRWDASYFRSVGLGKLADEGFLRIGTRVRPMGERIGPLTDQAARELGLNPGIPVGVSIIDAHAGGLGLLGARIAGETSSVDFNTRLALIGGTSTCHMAVSAEPRFIEGIWGPYYSAMLPGMWLTEGGQSATGSLIDHVIDSHVRGGELRASARSQGTTAYALLNAVLEGMADGSAAPAELTHGLHVYPDFHGNRSPLADPTLRGMISGLALTDGLDSLALLYLATIQGLSHGTRHILEAMGAQGYRIDTLVACGGDTKNPVFVREHADVAGVRIVMPKEPEAVLLGAAMLAAVAAGAYPDLTQAMAAMNHADRVIGPDAGQARAYHERKHRVFQRMHKDQLAYRALMA